MSIVAIDLKLPLQRYEQLANVARSRQLSVAEVAQTAVEEWLETLYRQSVEQSFIDGALAREEAIAVLGLERVEEIEHARRALAQDVARG